MVLKPQPVGNLIRVGGGGGCKCHNLHHHKRHYLGGWGRRGRTLILFHPHTSSKIIHKVVLAATILKVWKASPHILFNFT